MTTPAMATPGRVDPQRRALRRRFRSLRRQLPLAAQIAHAEAVARHFCSGHLILNCRHVGVYLANVADGELSTDPLIARLLAARKRVALPVVGRDGVMTFHRYRRSTPLVGNRYGIAEPRGTPPVSPLALDLLLMPLVAFDDHGVRLGMGAGYYDRFLARISPRLRPRLVGLAHEVQRSGEPLPDAPWDVPLHGVLTEGGWHPAIG